MGSTLLISINEYLVFFLQTKVVLAKGQKILDIALDLGYGSPNAFTVMFKKQLGIVPSAFFAIDH
jgi:AraC-like DNA-binding protein